MKAVVSWTPVVDGGLGGAASFYGSRTRSVTHPAQQRRSTALPHSTQNFAPAMSGAPQCGQNRMPNSYIRMAVVGNTSADIAFAVRQARRRLLYISAARVLRAIREDIMQLYDSFGPNPRAMRMFLAEKGIDIPRKEVDLMKAKIASPRTPIAIRAASFPRSNSTTASASARPSRFGNTSKRSIPIRR